MDFWAEERGYDTDRTAETRLFRLTLLAPDIVSAIFSGRRAGQQFRE